MVIALGAAAKHSQFEGQAYSTDYLKLSVKMVSGDHDQVASARPVIVPVLLVAFSESGVPAEAPWTSVCVPVTAPLLL